MTNSKILGLGASTIVASEWVLFSVSSYRLVFIMYHLVPTLQIIWHHNL
jgi:hypothetical protein